MPVLNPTVPMEALPTVTAAILFSLLDALVEKGLFTKGEVWKLIHTANNGVAARMGAPGTMASLQLMSQLMVHFSERPA